jgi:hypothetical protein
MDGIKGIEKMEEGIGMQNLLANLLTQISRRLWWRRKNLAESSLEFHSVRFDAPISFRGMTNLQISERADIQKWINRSVWTNPEAINL